jgi:hypothetical protein
MGSISLVPVFLRHFICLILLLSLGGCSSRGVTKSSFKNLEGTGDDPCPWGLTVMDTSMEDAVAIAKIAMDEVFDGKEKFHERKLSYSVKLNNNHTLTIESFLVKNLNESGPSMGAMYEINKSFIDISGH